VVPTFREAANIPLLVERIAEAMRPAGWDYEIIIVDDNSADGTDAACGELVRQGHPLRLIVRTSERGLSSAVIHGLRQGAGELLACMDADLSHPPEALPAMLATLITGGPEFVIGSRYVKGASTDEHWGLLRYLNSRVATLLARPFTSARDPMAGFFAMPRAVFERADRLNPIGYKIGLELLVKCQVRKLAEVPIHFADRRFGQSKLSLREQLNYIRHLKRLADYKFGAFSELAQFCLVGGIGTLVNLAVLTVLLWAHLAFWLASAAAIWLSMTSNFYLNRRLTFSFSRRHSPWRPYLRFVASCSVGAVINWALAVGLVEHVVFFGRHQAPAQLIGIVAGTAFNFVLSRHWVFRRLRPAQEGPRTAGQQPGSAPQAQPLDPRGQA
jgi:dolichol-phosphate mannosyltransferase